MIRKGIAWCDQIGQGIVQIAKICGAWALMGWIGKDPEQQSGGPACVGTACVGQKGGGRD